MIIGCEIIHESKNRLEQEKGNQTRKEEMKPRREP